MAKTSLYSPLAALLLAACAQIGPASLGRDQIAYSRALDESQKRQTLLNVIRLRYADAPTFLDATQVISGYQLQRNVTGGFEAFPTANPSTYLNGSGSMQYQESPTFTYQPLAGEAYAESIIRPLPPETVLPLALGDLPIDVLFRLVVQSINGWSNATALSGAAGAGSPEYFRLLHDLRLLQIRGLLSVHQVEARAKSEKPGAAEAQGMLMGIRDTDDPELRPVAAEARRLLGIPGRLREARVVYGRRAPEAGEIAILTRSMLAVLSELAYNAHVPDRDVREGRTVATLDLVNGEIRPVVIIHSGDAAPQDAFVAVDYRGHAYWISDTDFDSKLAFSVVQIIMALAATSHSTGTVITIPAG